MDGDTLRIDSSGSFSAIVALDNSQTSMPVRVFTVQQAPRAVRVVTESSAAAQIAALSEPKITPRAVLPPAGKLSDVTNRPSAPGKSSARSRKVQVEVSLPFDMGKMEIRAAGLC